VCWKVQEGAEGCKSCLVARHCWREYRRIPSTSVHRARDAVEASAGWNRQMPLSLRPLERCREPLDRFWLIMCAPIPSASKNTTVDAKTGFFLNARTPYLKSCQSISIDVAITIV